MESSAKENQVGEAYLTISVGEKNSQIWLHSSLKNPKNK